MISLVKEGNNCHAVVFDEFTLQDFREFEDFVVQTAKQGKAVSILVDLRNMIGYTLDMALEELRFTREHGRDIARIAVVTTDQWVTWSAWLSRMVSEAEMQVFDDIEEATVWVSATAPA